MFRHLTQLELFWGSIKFLGLFINSNVTPLVGWLRKCSSKKGVRHFDFSKKNSLTVAYTVNNKCWNKNVLVKSFNVNFYQLMFSKMLDVSALRWSIYIRHMSNSIGLLFVFNNRTFRTGKFKKVLWKYFSLTDVRQNCQC